MKSAFEGEHCLLPKKQQQLTLNFSIQFFNMYKHTTHVNQQLTFKTSSSLFLSTENVKF